MNYTIEQTEEEIIVRFPNPTTSATVQLAVEHLRSLEVLRDLIKPAERNFDEIEAAKLLTDIKKGIGDRTRDFLTSNEEFQRLIAEEE